MSLKYEPSSEPQVLGEILTTSEAAARLQTPKRRAAAKTTLLLSSLELSEAKVYEP